MADQENKNEWNEPIMLPSTFVHPNAGKYKDKPEEFFKDTAVRILLDVDAMGSSMLLPVWLDVVEFRDELIGGRPMRLGIGKVQTTSTGVMAGDELVFAPEEVIDVFERMPAQPGGLYMPLASAV